MQALSTLGHPVVMVELTEPQLEQAISITGSFISQFYPSEHQYAYFYTNPLQSTYPLPPDAYWVQDVKWDPATTRIGDIFSSESFLFCFPGGTQILTVKGPMICEDLCKKFEDVKVRTAFRPHKVRMRWNERKQQITILKTKNDFLMCTPNHPINCNNKFIPAEACKLGDKLLSSKDKLCEVIDKSANHTMGTWSIQNKTGSQYISAAGKEFYLTH
jgi:hypothetical protein